MTYLIHHFKSLTSTQDKAKEFASKDIFNVAIIADQQTKGRGRMQRKWQSSKGNLYVSIVLKPTNIKDIQHLTFAAAIAIVKVLSKLNISTRIKWPNDVNYNGKKLCGILTEGIFGKENYAIVGIGLNINQETFDKEISDRATSLKIIKNKRFDVKKISKEILEEFLKLEKLYNKNKLKDIRKLWLKYSDTIGKEISINTSNGIVKGKAVSLNDDCSLKVKTKSTMIDIYEGDVSIRY